MSGYRRVNYYELCRLCTSSEGNKMNIFREEGRRRQLQTKIQNYLPIQILEEDSLPKCVCHECVRKLENYIEFRETVVSAEGMLESYFTSLRFSEDFLKEGKVYVKSNIKDGPAPSVQSDEEIKIEKIPSPPGEAQIIVNEPQPQHQQPVVVNNLNASNIQIVQQYKCAMQMQPGGVAAAVVESTAETHYSYQQQTSQQLSPQHHSPQGQIIEPQVQQPQIQVQNQIQNQPQMTLQPQRQQPQQVQTITISQQQLRENQMQQLRELEKRQIQIEKEQSQNQQQVIQHQNNNVLLKPEVNVEQTQQTITKEEIDLNESGENVQNYTTVQGNSDVFLSLGFKDSSITERDEVKEYLKSTDDTINRNSIGQISEFLRIRTCPDTNSLITVNPQAICQTGRNLVCRDCGKNFDSINELNSHECPTSPMMNDVSEMTEKDDTPQNNSSNSFSCDICAKPFKRKEHLFQHRKLHTGERPYVCTTCAKAFSRKEHLVRHSVSHTGQKMHECEMCGKSFSRKDNLHKHRKTHGVSGPYICETCGKSFVVKHYYLMHLTSHAPTVIDGDCQQDPLPYKCDLCHKAFSVKQYLTTHKLRHRSKSNSNALSHSQQQVQQQQQQPVTSTNDSLSVNVSGNSVVTSSSNLTSANGQNNDPQIVDIHNVIERNEQSQQHATFAGNQYNGNVQQFQ